MKKLWIDDIRDPPPESVNEAIDMLMTEDIELISFDHDLGEGEDAYQVALWIENRSVYKQINPIQWRIHSANPVGAERIRQAMLSAEKFWKEI
jgi:hypothetical protein